MRLRKIPRIIHEVLKAIIELSILALVVVVAFVLKEIYERAD